MPSLSIHILSLALCLSSGFQQGYIASVLNQPYIQMQRFINQSWIDRYGSPLKSSTLDMMWSFLNVCFPIAMIFGQFLAAVMCKRIGRKGTALVASAVYIPATLLSAGAKLCHSFELLYVGRILWSLANGVNSVNATVWIVECAPAKIRGRMAAMQEFFMAAGALVTQALGVPFSDDVLWPWIFLPNIAFVVASLIMFLFLYESPQYLMQKGHAEKARKALASYHGVTVEDSSLDSELRICEEALKKKDGKEKAKSGSIQTEHDSLTILFMPWKARDPVSQVVRHGAWLGVMVKIAYVFTGARCLRSYSTFVLYSMAGWSHNAALLESLIIGIVRLPTTLIPVFLVDRIGRRPMLIGSMGVCFASLLIMLAGIDIGPSWRIATLIGLSTLLLISACGIGSLSRFYSAELVPRNILLSSVSILTMFEALTKIGVEFAFYPLANVIHGQSMFLFLAPTGVFMVMMWMCPETSKRSVNEVLNDMARRKNLYVIFPT
ncbi:hypothetical protein Y032_0001g272 [Ancylostoma ceylanicum]|uniref:Major facilitator superfamily (MFS) profile domain-containing protein n=1 Tax=Ancylostoma ceylanicum TaxID=53326 RepID=A0A016W3J1_9BILA|nr:hypothetical protein Y032_0001g272 [Ancylostoma ceylanicum]